MSNLRHAARGAALGLAGWIGLACGAEPESQVTGSSMAGPAARAEGAEAPSGAPVIESVRLDPARPQPGDRVRAVVEARGPSGDAPRLEYEWFVNGARQESTRDSLHVQGSAGRGGAIAVSVVAVAGEERSLPTRVSARIGNSPPVLHGVIIEPLGEVTAGRDITASPKASDPDGDDLSFDYRWDVNGRTVARGEPILSASQLSRGDEVVVTVVAKDGRDESNPIRSAPIPVVNAVPVVTSKPGGFDEQGRFIYPLTVVDPDGDTGFRYRLAEGPPDMQIDLVDGTLRWIPREDQAGEYRVVVEVTDSQGGTGRQSFLLNLAFGDEQSAPANAAPSE